MSARSAGPHIRFAVAGVVSALVAAVSACAPVGPDYHLPASALINAPTAEGRFVGAAGNRAVVEAPLPTNWWRLYQSADLDRLVSQAFTANTDLRVAEANLERSRAMVSAAKAAGQPNAALNLDFAREQLSAEQYLYGGALPVENLYDVGLTASYELDLFGRIRRGVEAAKADDEAVEAARDLVRVSVAADVTRAYAEVCSAGDQLTTARASLALQQQSLSLTQRLVKAGRGTTLDLTRSQGQIDQFRASIPALEAGRRNALFRLATLTGRPPAEFEAGLTRCVNRPRPGRADPRGGRRRTPETSA